jgi:hypothetical protein
MKFERSRKRFKEMVWLFRRARWEQQMVALRVVTLQQNWRFIDVSELSVHVDPDPGDLVYVTKLPHTASEGAVCPVTRQYTMRRPQGDTPARVVIRFGKLRRIYTKSPWLIWIRMTTKLAGKPIHPDIRPVVVDCDYGKFMFGWLEYSR